MALVRDLVLELTRIIDPVRETDLLPFTEDTIGVVDGKIYSKELLLDIYNKARSTLYDVLRAKYSLHALTRLLGSCVRRNANFEFTGGVAKRPDGYYEAISISDKNGKPIIILPNDLQQVVQEGRNPHYKESADNRFVFELSGLSAGVGGLEFSDTEPIDLSDSAPVNFGDSSEGVGEALFVSLSGDTFIPDGRDYVIVYMGMPTYKLSDITNGTTVESFDPRLHKWIIEFGTRISLQRGMVDAMAFARGLLNA